MSWRMYEIFRISFANGTQFSVILKSVAWCGEIARVIILLHSHTLFRMRGKGSGTTCFFLRESKAAARGFTVDSHLVIFFLKFLWTSRSSTVQCDATSHCNESYQTPPLPCGMECGYVRLVLSPYPTLSPGETVW